jgi:hypothetical protein
MPYALALRGNDTSGIISIEVQRHKQSSISEDASWKNDRERRLRGLGFPQ